MEELLFKKGQLANLPQERQTGTFYVTEDAKTIYIDNMVIQDTEDVKEELIGIIVDNELVTAESLTYLNENKADITALNAVEDKIPVKTSQLTNDSGYITLNDVPEVDLSGYSKTGHTHNDLYYTETEINTKLNGKQDKISDLETIRSGATLGATALQAVPEVYATKEYVGGEVSKLVGSAPETLNTLEELAQALNNNADIVTVLNNAIATKASIDDLSAYTTNALHEELKAEVNENELVAAQALTKLNNEKANKSDIPTSLSQLTNDSGFITASQVPTQDLSGYVTTEALDAKGYLTEIPSTYVTESELEAKNYLTSVPTEYVTETELNNKGYLTSVPEGYALKTEIPTKVSQLANDSNFITQDTFGALQNSVDSLANEVDENEYVAAQALTKLDNEKANKTEIPTKVSQLANDSGFITASEVPTQDLSGYVTTEALNAKGYITSVPDEYVTETELLAKGYITSVPSEYVTETELSAKKYLTAIPSEYITESELEAKGYLTSVPSEYVTEDVLSGYTTTEQFEELYNGVIDNELVISRALTQLDTDKANVSDIPTNISELNNDKGYLTEIPSEYVTEMNTKISEMQALITQLQGEIETLKTELNKTLVVE